MTNATVPVTDKEDLPRHHRWLHHATAGADLIPKKKIPLVDREGNPAGHIHQRLIQQLAWSAIAAFLLAAFVAGGYYLATQTSNTVHSDWNNLFHFANWTIYRHIAARNMLEPELATIGVLTILCKPKYWTVKVSNARLALTPFLILALALAANVAFVYLLLRFTGRVANWQVLVGGIIIGRVLHKVWAPCGATINAVLLDRSVDAAKLRAQNDSSVLFNSDKPVPLWVTLPLAPPTMRERFSWMWTHDTDIKQRGRLKRLVLAGAVIFVLVTIVGFLARYYIADGHYIPVLVPHK